MSPLTTAVLTTIVLASVALAQNRQFRQSRNRGPAARLDRDDDRQRLGEMDHRER
jgi:hypothetical protein